MDSICLGSDSALGLVGREEILRVVQPCRACFCVYKMATERGL